MSTFEVDADPQPPSPTATTANPLDSAARDGDISPISSRTKSALSNHASLLAQPGRTLDLAERKWLQEKWHSLDTSGDGMLDFQETKVMLRDIKNRMTEQEIAAAFQEMDADGCGAVDFDEFYLWFANQDAEQFAHLMSRGALRQFVRSVLVLGVSIVLPILLITVLLGPDPVVSCRGFAPPLHPRHLRFAS